ncbi:hypothetical protein NC651_020598 [Populus alba x Populus x berolinensis]|nr:hypothetical protein NC651_020598 [Populus alba x Populus x berolinensis]
MGVDQPQGSPSYYSFLGQWHPDRRTRTPSLLGEAKCKLIQQIQKAYSGLYDPLDEEEEEDDDDGEVDHDPAAVLKL